MTGSEKNKFYFQMKVMLNFLFYKMYFAKSKTKSVFRRKLFRGGDNLKKVLKFFEIIFISFLIRNINICICI